MTEVALRVQGLTKRYGDLTAVDDLTLEARRGEILGLLGPNGAGKTTTISMMVGLLRPDAGQVWVDGKAGICPQQIVLWPKLTCLEQLEFIGEMHRMARREARRRGVALLEAMGLIDKRDALARTLSGGMQRRLNLIMALVHDPDVIVLDEPEAGLDPQSRVLVREYVKGLARAGKAVILTTHNMDEADRMAGRVAIIDHGKLRVTDTPESLKRTLGDGDVLELAVDGDAGAVAAAAGAVGGAVEGETVAIRGRGLLERLPAILETLRAAGVRPVDVRLRENSLEDVFLALTGRRLRE